MLRKLIEEKYAQTLICLGIFIAMLVGGGIFTWFLMSQVEKIGQCLLIYVIIPLVIIVILAILVKRYLLGGKK